MCLRLQQQRCRAVPSHCRAEIYILNVRQRWRENPRLAVLADPPEIPTIYMDFPPHIYTLAVAREMERQYLRRVHERPAPVTWSGSSPLAWCHTCV